MEHKTRSKLFTKKKILGYVSTRVREKGGKRKAIFVVGFYVLGICALLFGTEETMRDTYGRSIVHVKLVIFFCLVVTTFYGVRDYLNYQKNKAKKQ